MVRSVKVYTEKTNQLKNMPKMNVQMKKRLHEVPMDMQVLQKLRIIIQTAHKHSAVIKKKTGISGAQLWLLQEIADEDGVKVGDAARRMSLKSTTVSNLVESLIELNLIQRFKDKADQRVVRLSLTSKGKILIKKAPKPTRGFLPDSLKLLSKKELIDLNKSLDHLLEQISQLDSKLAMEPLPFTV